MLARATKANPALMAIKGVGRSPAPAGRSGPETLPNRFDRLFKDYPEECSR